MHIKQHQRLVKAVAPSLEPGELTQLTGRARVTTVPALSSGSTVAVAVKSPAAVSADAFLVLTDRRLLVLETGALSRPSSRVRQAIPRGELTLLRFKRGA